MFQLVLGRSESVDLNGGRLKSALHGRSNFDRINRIGRFGC
jgi:hypothetical protein